VPIRIIHLGVGVRGRHWLEIVAAHPDFVSVACVDTDERSLQAARSSPGQEHGQFLRSVAEAFGRVEADAALIASPTFLHAEHCRQALDAGLAVLLEKPLATTLSDAVAVVERARAVSRPCVVAENYRFFPAERTVRRMLDEDLTGRISQVVCIDRRDQPSHTQGPWVKGIDHPFLSEIAVHHFDSFRYLFKRRPVAMTARSYNPTGSTYDREGAAEALIEMEGGFPIVYAGSYQGNRFEFSLWVQGDKGDLWTDRKRVWWRARGKRFFFPSKLTPVPKGDELPYPKGGTVSLLNQFRDAVLKGATAETSAQDNLWTIAMVEASIRSHHDGRKVPIAEILTPELRHRAGLEAS
jgi:predicted dehydrogenase